MTSPDPSRADSQEHLPPKVEDQLDQEARKRARGDIALWFHHRSLLLGEYFIRRRSKAHWDAYMRTKALPQYRAVVQSVIRGWRVYHKKITGIPPEKQADKYAVHCDIVLDALRGKARDQHADVLKRLSRTLYTAAKRGDTDFFRAVGRLLSGKGKSDYLKRFKYAHATLSHWLTDGYWLMPAKLVSYRLSLGLGVGDDLNRFLMVKKRYGLKSHRPTLIKHFAPVAPGTEALVLTAEGQRLLGNRPHPLSR